MKQRLTLRSAFVFFRGGWETPKRNTVAILKNEALSIEKASHSEYRGNSIYAMNEATNARMA